MSQARRLADLAVEERAALDNPETPETLLPLDVPWRHPGLAPARGQDSSSSMHLAHALLIRLLEMAPTALKGDDGGRLYWLPSGKGAGAEVTQPGILRAVIWAELHTETTEEVCQCLLDLAKVAALHKRAHRLPPAE